MDEFRLKTQFRNFQSNCDVTSCPETQIFGDIESFFGNFALKLAGFFAKKHFLTLLFNPLAVFRVHLDPANRFGRLGISQIATSGY